MRIVWACHECGYEVVSAVTGLVRGRMLLFFEGDELCEHLQEWSVGDE